MQEPILNDGNLNRGGVKLVGDMCGLQSWSCIVLLHWLFCRLLLRRGIRFIPMTILLRCSLEEHMEQILLLQG